MENDKKNLINHLESPGIEDSVMSPFVFPPLFLLAFAVPFTYGTFLLQDDNPVRDFKINH